MPWTYSIDEKRDVLLVKASGVFSDADLHAMRIVTTRDSRFHPGIRALFDYLEVNQSSVTYQGAGSWPTGQLYGPKSRRAILTNPGLHETIARLFQNSINPQKNGRVLVSTDRAELLTWLNEGVPPERWVE